ncbi:PAS domain-containing protein [cf. Phormidesmis sp. LEGE 11477]|uniref:PAS domain-containing protein n=1 Tax=cf. Phormidesmis sp. LEGE 11477 TaxID=1828680 RepID=UPI00187E6040|nr:PAS domain-containing protein [cf. Phormidesmis sp. LEGE 11477]MBE9060913.1 PAS domain-containing protein [cf. Phormidesmis sp. LEGE 11477]
MNEVISASSPSIDSTASKPPLLDPGAFYHALWTMSEHRMYALEVIDDGADFRFIAFNRACAAQSPVPVEQIKGQRLSAAFSSDVFGLYQRHYSNCVRTRQVASFEEKLAIGEHTTYWQLTVYPLLAPTGKITQLVVSSTDITQKKQAALALTESRQLLQQVINTVPAAIFWKDCDSRYLGCNQTFANIAGKNDIEELVGKNDYDLVWKKEESDWFIECDQRIMKADQPEIDIVEPQLQANGRQAWIKTSKIPLHDASGKVNGLLGIVEDITDRKEAEETKNRLLAILEATPDVISITDAQGNHHYLNQAGQRIFAVNTPQQIASLKLSDLMPSDVADRLITIALPQAERQGIWAGESTIRDHRGIDIPVSHVIVCHQVKSGEVQHFSSIMRDISDRKANETTLKAQSKELSRALQQIQRTQAQIIQAEKMSGLGQMVAGVAHEINNPVNFIHANLKPATSYIQDLLELIDLYHETYPNASPSIKETLGTIELDFIREDLPKLLGSMSMGTQRIREIVLSLRNFSRLDESEVKTVNLHDGIDSTLVILNHRFKSDNAHTQIQVVKQYGNLPLVDCYPSQINQVLMNILSNAIDALEKVEDPTITLITEAQENTVSIRIRDNGSGIPLAVQSQILNPFFTTKEVGKGTGMGMPISYQIITEKHNGQMNFTSEEGKGTEFCLSLPIHQPGNT